MAPATARRIPAATLDCDRHELGRPLLAVFCYNHGHVIDEALSRMPSDPSFDVLLCDDSSTDDTAHRLRHSGLPMLQTERNVGIGASIKRAIAYARDHGYKVLVVMAGNGKDDPREVERLLRPIYDAGYEYVQGSRSLEGASGDTAPLFRRMLVPVHAKLFSWLTGVPQTDALNGFRAYRLSLFYDAPRIDIWQDWLDRYEFETYLHYKVLTLGRKFIEVPITKNYAHFKPGQQYSHIRPIVDWWSILRPLLLLKLRIRR